MSTPTIQANLFTTGLSDVGYQGYDSGGALLASRVTAGITEASGTHGIYVAANPTYPAGAVGFYWNSTGTSTAWNYVPIDERMPNVDFAASGGLPQAVDGSGRVDALNLTNAPTNGDLTNAMKTSVTTAATAATPTINATQSFDNSGQTTALPANLKQILGTALTETAGQIAAAFKQFFNIASPTSTMNRVTLVDTTTTTGAATNVGTVNGLAAGVITATSIAADAITAAKIADGAIDAATFAAGAIDATAIAADAIGSSELATTAVNEIRDAILSDSTAFAGANIAAIKTKTDTIPASPAAVGSAMTLTAAYDAAKTASQAGDAMTLTSGERTTLTAVIWAALTSGLTTANSIGKRLVDFVTTSVYSAPPSAASIATTVRDVNNTSPAASSLGAAVNSAASAGDPWATALPGSYGAGTAGKIVGDNINATVSSRLPTSSYTAPPSVGAIATQVDTTLTASHGAGSWQQGSTSGSGAFAVTVTVTDGSAALQNATVRLVEGANAYTTQTNSSGVASFSLDAATYALTITKAGYSFTPATITVSASGNFAKAMTAIVIPAQSDPALTTVYAHTYSQQGAVLSGEAVSFTLVTAPSGTGAVFNVAAVRAISDSNGLVSVGLLKDATYKLSYRGTVVTFSTGTDDTKALGNLIG